MLQTLYHTLNLPISYPIPYSDLQPIYLYIYIVTGIISLQAIVLDPLKKYFQISNLPLKKSLDLFLFPFYHKGAVQKHLFKSSTVATDHRVYGSREKLGAQDCNPSQLSKLEKVANRNSDPPQASLDHSLTVRRQALKMRSHSSHRRTTTQSAQRRRLPLSRNR